MTTKESQVERFIETARMLGCDEDKDRFEKSLGKIAAYKPPKKKPSKKAAAAKVKCPDPRNRAWRPAD
jgi:hypothetical protein